MGPKKIMEAADSVLILALDTIGIAIAVVVLVKIYEAVIETYFPCDHKWITVRIIKTRKFWEQPFDKFRQKCTKCGEHREVVI